MDKIKTAIEKFEKTLEEERESDGVDYVDYYDKVVSDIINEFSTKLEGGYYTLKEDNAEINWRDHLYDDDIKVDWNNLNKTIIEISIYDYDFDDWNCDKCEKKNIEYKIKEKIHEKIPSDIFTTFILVCRIEY